MRSTCGALLRNRQADGGHELAGAIQVTESVYQALNGRFSSVPAARASLPRRSRRFSTCWWTAVEEAAGIGTRRYRSPTSRPACSVGWETGSSQSSQGILQFVSDPDGHGGSWPGSATALAQDDALGIHARALSCRFNAFPLSPSLHSWSAPGFVLRSSTGWALSAREGSVGDFLVLILAREMAPVVTTLILIGRSGTVILDEVAHLSLNGQIRVLESHGVDPTDLIAVPRTFAIAVAVFVLNMLFLHLALWSGYLGATLTGLTAISLLEFVENVLQGVTLKDHLLLLIKPLIIGLVTPSSRLAGPEGRRPRHWPYARRCRVNSVYSLLATLSDRHLISAVLWMPDTPHSLTGNNIAGARRSASRRFAAFPAGSGSGSTAGPAAPDLLG